VIEQTAAGTGLIAIMDSSYRPADEAHLENIAFCIWVRTARRCRMRMLRKTRLWKLPMATAVVERIKEIKKDSSANRGCHPRGTDHGGHRARHRTGWTGRGRSDSRVADANGNELTAQKPRFLKEMIRQIHTTLNREGHSG